MVTKKQARTLGLAAAAAAAAAGAAAGYYFYASKDAKKNRRIASRWAASLKNDVVRQAKRVGDLDRETLLGIVDTVVASYETVRGIDQAELERAGQELKDNWRLLRGEVGTRSASTSAGKSVRSTARKSSARASKGRTIGRKRTTRSK